MGFFSALDKIIPNEIDGGERLDTGRGVLNVLASPITAPTNLALRSLGDDSPRITASGIFDPQNARDEGGQQLAKIGAMLGAMAATGGAAGLGIPGIGGAGAGAAGAGGGAGINQVLQLAQAFGGQGGGAGGSPASSILNILGMLGGGQTPGINPAGGGSFLGAGSNPILGILGGLLGGQGGGLGGLASGLIGGVGNILGGLFDGNGGGAFNSRSVLDMLERHGIHSTNGQDAQPISGALSAPQSQAAGGFIA